jgi:hypothetical protein
MGFDAGHGAGHIGLAVDHVAAIDYDGGQFGDAQVPGIGDTLPGAANAALQCRSAIAQTLLCEVSGWPPCIDTCRQ